MKKVFLPVLAILVIAAMAAGGYLYLTAPKGAHAAGAGQAGEPVSQAGKQADSIKNPVYVELDPLVLPIIGNNGVSQLVSMSVLLEVSEKNSEKVEALGPKLTDAFIEDMYGSLAQKAALKGGVIQVSIIKNRLRTVSDEILGQDIVGDVLLQAITQRRI